MSRAAKPSADPEGTPDARRCWLDKGHRGAHRYTTEKVAAVSVAYCATTPDASALRTARLMEAFLPSGMYRGSQIIEVLRAALASGDTEAGPDPDKASREARHPLGELDPNW